MRLLRPLILSLLFSSLAHGAGEIKFPEVEVIDQDGKKRSFYTDLVKDEVVAINFIFTGCETICPVSGAYFGKLVEMSKEHPDKKIKFISVTLDPTNDTPAKLKAWAKQFGHSSDWTLVTGTPANIDQILKALGAFTADKDDHAPLVLVGSDAKHQWTHIQGFTAPKTIWESLVAYTTPKAPVPPQKSPTPPHPYFPDTELVDHRGEEVKFYTDLVKGKVVVIHCFFSSCTGACPVLLAKFKILQQAVGKDVDLISITLDPTHDTPEFLGKYAAALKTGSNWRFLTGTPAKVEQVLAKLGFATEDKDDHSNVIIIGNEKTGLWKKARGTASSDEIAKIIRSVADDEN